MGVIGVMMKGIQPACIALMVSERDMSKFSDGDHHQLRHHVVITELSKSDASVNI